MDAQTPPVPLDRVHPHVALWSSFLLTVLAFAALVTLLRPGYAINDDVKVLSIAAGYPAGNPSPFLVHTNVMLGFLLSRLFTLRTSLNWYSLLLELIVFASIWALLKNFAWDLPDRSNRFAACLLILACGSYFALNLTFTSAALLSGFAGLLLLISSSELWPGRPGRAVIGIAFLLIASLLRLETLIIPTGCILAGLVFITRSSRIKGLLIPCAIAATVIVAGYAFNRLYVRAFPDWNQFYFYNRTRESLHDAHRLENLHTEIRQVGWSTNDQELFARWFYPDPGIYSLDHLRYLVDHTSGFSTDPAQVAASFMPRLLGSDAAPFLILAAAGILASLSNRASWRLLAAQLAILAAAIGGSLVLAWAYKDPDYVFLSTLAGAAISLAVLKHLLEPASALPPSGAGSSWNRIFSYASWVMLAMGLALAAWQAVSLSTVNRNKALAYQGMLEDMAALRADGRLAPNALIVSPAHGLPMEWADPFLLSFPPIAYLDTGWITFSPYYWEVLQAHGITSLPDALYQDDNVYLMTRAGFTVFLSRYYLEHEGITVRFDSIYEMPNVYHFAGYDDIHIFKVVRLK